MGKYTGWPDDKLDRLLVELQSDGKTEQAALALSHELQVQQIELEQQNRELKETQRALEESRSRYAELFDFAPTGYLELDAHGNIREINLTGANLLGQPRERLSNYPLSVFMAVGESRLLHAHLRKVLVSNKRDTCTLRGKDPLSGPRLFRLESVPHSYPEEMLVRSVISDASEQMSGERDRQLRASKDASKRTRKRILAGLEKMSSVATGTFNPDILLQRVTEVLLEEFEADRAWLLYPCDPDATELEVVAETDLPEYPGAFRKGEKIPVGSLEKHLLQRALTADHPIVDFPLRAGMASAKRFSVRALMVVAVRPETGDSWLMGVHQCREERGWTDEDKELFQAMAERLRDVIQVVNIRQTLEQSERRLSFALEGADDAIWDWDIRGGFTYFSPRCTEWLGFERQPISTPSVPCYERMHRDDREPTQFAFEKHLKGNSTRFESEFRIKAKDTQWHWILARGKAVERNAQGMAVRVVGTYSDISQRRAMEDELRLSRARLQRAQELAHLGGWEYDFATAVAEWTPEALRILGLEQDVDSNLERLLDITHPEDRPKLDDALESSREHGGSYDVEFRIKRNDGSERILHSKAKVFDNDQGKPTRLIGAIQDITERKQLDERIRQHQNTLARVGRINTMGEIATAIAHEVNQPLTAISMYAGGAQQRLSKSTASAAEILPVLEEIASLAERSGAIIKRIREFTRQRSLEFARVNLNEVVGESVAMISAEFRSQGMTVRSQLASDPPVILGDQIQLEQVVINFLINGMEAMLHKPATERSLIVSTSVQDEHWIKLEVKDRGAGVPDELAGRLFEPFVSTKDDGTGMGLSISQTIIDAHNGRIWAIARKEGGTTFGFHLPISKNDENE